MTKRNSKLPSGMVKRGRVYHSNFRFEGKHIRVSLSSDLSVAKEMLAALRHKLYRRSIGDISNEYPLEKLTREWIRSISQKLAPSSVVRYQQNLDNVLRLLPASDVAQLNLDAIEDFRERRLLEKVRHTDKYVKPQTVNKDVAALSNMLNWAVRRQKIGSNPITNIAKLPEYPRESRALEAHEVESLLKCSTEHWRRVWYGYLASGTRKMELANILFTDVDWQAKELIIRAGYSKNGRARRIPLDPRLLDITVQQKEQADHRQPGNWSDQKTNQRILERFSKQHVFVSTANTPLGGNVYRAFKSSCKRAGISTTTTNSHGEVVEVVSLHSTRHTFASNLILNGADPRSVQQLLGHRTLDMTMKIYAKLFIGQQRSAISKLSIGEGMTFENE